MNEKNTIEGTGLAAFEQVLERYGSDRTRWPAPVRKRFAGLLARNREAAERLREAEALDRLLDLAPPPAVDTGALAARIMAAVEDETAPAPRAVPRRSWLPEVLTAPFGSGGRSYAPAAALLAASLVLGMFTGLSGTFETTMRPLMTAEVADESDIDLSQIAFDSNVVSFFEEDYL